MAGLNHEQTEQIRLMSEWVKEKLAAEGTGHDWLHIERVRNVSFQIAKEEGADLFMTEACALLHDVIDEKLSDEHRVPLQELKRHLSEDWKVDPETVDGILAIITRISFRDREKYKDEPLSKEGMVVQDADRLDAIGAVGIARALMYAGAKGHLLYGSGDAPNAVSHFYEKLLLLKDLMNTKTGRMLAEKRHKLMLEFLGELENECAFSRESRLDRSGPGVMVE
ncbi:HD domain-containing protein [Bacillus haynesii]|uniref:HD domain-containing protein n=1 Tax=Bacillus haynesii TaxID=1925021 RepID=UPI00228204C1|nr:HD domain-containing protein [Bacillus haynesii]MCY7754812.1 HD domain-containing protein [Bacillus haynesii]MCY8343115.1 HD domain-containing protein [Bacillus haynesii]